jgi:murein DD-endopeptidase MepM/ murein hydrolase activator NlpD
VAEEKKDDKQQHPEFAAVVVLICVLAVAWQSIFGSHSAKATPVVATGTCATSTADATGDCVLSATGWVRPVAAPIWSGFRTPDRPDHNGVDLGAARGTPIRAAAAGRVVRVTCDISPASHGCDQDGGLDYDGCGWYVDLQHEGDIYTRYCHMGQQPAVTVGQVVAAGQILGLVGSSGHSSGPHLHFEVHRGDETSATAVDPVPFMAEQGAPLGA